MHDPYASIADLYDFTYEDFTDDVDFYDNLARGVDGPLLELGAGSGRVALKLAQRGYEVAGIDNSASMLARARRNLDAAGKLDGSLELLSGDMAAFDLGRRFAMVYIAANTFQHLLTTAQQQACLACVARHLQPGGVFAMGVRSPASVSWDDSSSDWAPLLLNWTRTDPATGDKIMKLVADQPDPERMVRRLTYVFDRVAPDGAVRRSIFETELRHSTQAELTLLLQQVGLRVTHVYGDYDLAPVGIGENLVFVARAEAPAESRA
jgi:SAM-dependent methyltransferase